MQKDTENGYAITWHVLAAQSYTANHSKVHTPLEHTRYRSTKGASATLPRAADRSTRQYLGKHDTLLNR